MINRIKTLLLISVLAATGPARPVVAGCTTVPRARVVFRESGALAPERLRALLPDTLCAENARDTLETLQRSLHAGLGYYLAQLDECRLEGPSGAERIVVRIGRGPLSRIGEIKLLGAEGLAGRVFAPTLEQFLGQPASAQRVAALLTALARAAAERGYAFCRVDLESAAPDSLGNLRLVLRLVPGPRCLLGDVRLPGLETTRPLVALRLAGLRPGETYSESAVRGARGRLLRSGLFRQVAEPVVSRGASPWRADLSLPVSEGSASTLNAALGSGGAAGASGMSGVFRLELNNLLGTARQGRVAWERPRRDWSSLELSYREPWLFGSGISLEASYNQSLRDSLYTSTRAGLRLSVQPGDYLRLGVGGSFERVSPGSETWELSQSSTRWAMEGRLERSNLLNPANPSRGTAIDAEALAGRRKIEGVGLREIRAGLSIRAFHPIIRSPHTAALAAGYTFVARGQSRLTDLPYHVRIPVGGASREGGPAVRGHPDEELRARRAAWLSLEYRYLTGPAGRLFLFYDFCAADVPAGPELSRPADFGWKVSYLQGYGAGLQLESRLGLLGLALAFQPGRGPGEARLHLSLSESF